MYEDKKSGRKQEKGDQSVWRTEGEGAERVEKAEMEEREEGGERKTEKDK